MNRILSELTPECEITTRLYAQGYEKKEISDMKCRAISTVNNQIKTAFDVLHVRNGRELARLVYERVTGLSLSMNFNPKLRAFTACILLCVFSITFIAKQDIFRRTEERIEYARRIY